MRRVAIVSAAVALAVVVAACASQPPTSTPGRTRAATASLPVGATAMPSPVALCTNPHGGVCLGPLAAGTYATRQFATPLTYTVPAGWANFEDLPGNFLLVPPTASLDELDAGTGDYVGVYDGVAVADAACSERRQSGIEQTPAAMVAWFVEHEGLDTTDPAAVTVGGLDGAVVDLRIADGYVDGCPYEGYEGVPMVPLFIGAGLAEVHHVSQGEIVTRLYILEGRGGRILVIEVSDVPGGTPLEELDAVVHEFVFG